MKTPFSLYRSEIDGFINNSCIDRIVTGFCRKDSYSTLTALYTPVNTPRDAIISRCRDRYEKVESTPENRKLLWIPPFRAWEMLTIGNLSLALLWHIYRSLPQEVLAEEKIIYKLGRISVTLPALTDGLHKWGNNYSLDPERHMSIMNKALPPDRKSSVSSIFSACEQISELSEKFRSIGKQIGDAGQFDALIVPVIDIDLCFPEQAISLLFAIRNFICCESISFIIAADRDTLINFFISLYDNSLTQKQGYTALQSLFDDWVSLPSPQLENIMQSIDINLITTEKEQLITLLQKSDIFSYITDKAQIHLAFNRFNAFNTNTLDTLSFNDYSIIIILFFLGTYNENLLKKLSLHPNCEDLLKELRYRDSNGEASAKKTTTLPNAPQFFPGNSLKNNRLKDFEHLGDSEKKEEMQLLSKIFSALPSSIPDTLIAQWIVKIIPFL